MGTSRKKFSAASFAARLKEARKRSGLTQVEFAELGGVKRVTQLLYEQAERYPDTLYLENLDKHGVDIIPLLVSDLSHFGEGLHFRPDVLDQIFLAADEMASTAVERITIFRTLAATFSGRNDPGAVQDVRSAAALFRKRQA